MGSLQKGVKPKKGYPKNPPPRGPETIRKNTGKGFPFGLIPVILAILLYVNTIPNKYCLDDYCVVVDNTYVHAGIHDIPTILTTNFFNGLHNFNDGLYRPLPILTYALEYSVIGMDSHFRHIINLLLYALSGLFVYLLTKRLLGNSVWLPLSVACLYIAHPVHTEVVANIKGRDDLLAFLLAIMASYYILEYIKLNNIRFLLYGFVSYCFALLSKESSITFLVIIPLMIFFFTKASRGTIIKIALVLMVISISWFSWRTHVIHSMTNPVDTGIFGAFNNSVLSTNDVFSRLATGLYLQSLYFLKLIFPIPLTHDYSFNQIPVVPALSFKSIISTIIISALFVYAIFSYKKARIVSFGILFYFITIASVANIFIYIGATFAERFLFTPSFGFSLVTGFLLFKLVKQDARDQKLLSFLGKNKIYALCLMVILVFYSAKTISRNFDWKNNLTLYSADVAHSSNSSRAHYNLGSELDVAAMAETSMEKRNDMLAVAASELKKALKIYPTYTDAWNNLGNVYQSLNKMDSSVICYKKVIEIDKDYQKGYLNLGIDYYKMQQYNDALPCLRKAYQFHPENETACFLLGDTYGRLGMFDDAIRYLGESVAINPKSLSTLILLGKAYGIKGDYKNSLAIFKRALEIDPGNTEVYFNLGITCRLMNQPGESIGYLLKCLQLKPDYPEAYAELIRNYELTGDKEKAEYYKRQLAGIKSVK
jgi:protein O-mannosyl-transferase